MEPKISPKPHPIVLNRVIFTRSIVIAIPEHTPVDGKETPPPENKINVSAVEGEPGRYIATMNTLLNQSLDPAVPYHIDMECVGMFIADLPPEEAVHGVTITAHNVLYGAIREAVSWITGRQPYGPLMLGLSVLRPKTTVEAK